MKPSARRQARARLPRRRRALLARIATEICARRHDTVALSGGVFMNRLLLQLLTRELKYAGLPSWSPHRTRQRRLHRLRSGGGRALPAQMHRSSSLSRRWPTVSRA
ncbi:MAG: hypothetical protein ACLTYW_07490 [Collinsella sp.]